MKKKIKKNSIDEPVPLLVHLSELRKRIIHSLIAIILCSIIMWPFMNKVLESLARPLGKLVFISPFEAFWIRIKLSFFLGLILSLPFVLFQIWNFIQKGLLPREKRFILPLTISSLFLFYLGGLFAYFLILPVGMKFLLSYGSETLVPMISVSRYLSFLLCLVFSFGLIFELPLVVGFLTSFGILKSDGLKRNRKVAILGIFIAAAALTPGPDIFSQLLLAVPLLILYEIGILVSKFIERRRCGKNRST
ncbi:MAG: twin-arginine translocase subunit TatC [Candidatus Omnitrophica bacterium]|nr:twin-arginine translocase subunit TatC [Candidatus Omnitrophota bacterium]